MRIFICVLFIFVVSFLGAVGLTEILYAAHFNMVWQCIFCGTVFFCPQSPYQDMIFSIFAYCPLCVFCMRHRPIRTHLDLTFIIGHYHVQLVGDRSASRLLYFMLQLHRADETQPGRNRTGSCSCPLNNTIL